MASARWTAADMPDQSGRTAIVTGANSGLGLATARELARAGAAVWLTGRSEAKVRGAMQAIQGQVPGADLTIGLLDLADLSSVRGFAESFAAPGRSLDLLINNAGIMAAPRRLTATDSRASSAPTISATSR